MRRLSTSHGMEVFITSFAPKLHVKGEASDGVPVCIKEKKRRAYVRRKRRLGKGNPVGSFPLPEPLVLYTTPLLPRDKGDDTITYIHIYIYFFKKSAGRNPPILSYYIMNDILLSFLVGGFIGLGVPSCVTCRITKEFELWAKRTKRMCCH